MLEMVSSISILDSRALEKKLNTKKKKKKNMKKRAEWSEEVKEGGKDKKRK